ncbi:hypothetical protein LMG24238_00510 [Paraburkholderia sediminicola]|uniref:Uncharacterized protein n=1 Tax=Paraburkholderia sediminicola TaxID=458836 RepID=A0A6J4ZV41_9BURK|nr:hypothetical protein [Paraburkholderia sediminicola]CAB3643635.1 hypothetical protein LMG24238_00510 [Paraburkholderia sediminicola]
MKEKPLVDHALHPEQDRLLTVEDYLREFSGDASVGAPAARCPLCGEALHIVQSRGRKHVHYFSHADGALALCPLAADALPNPILITAQPPNIERERKQREAFSQHWRAHLQAMREQVPELSVVRFMRIVEHADVLHLWACPTLEQADVPYIFLALAEFIARTPGAPQSAWVRFWFDASVQSIADLRKPRPAPPRLFRLHYRSTRTSMFPGGRHLLGYAEVPMSVDFLNESTRLMRSEVMTFETFLAQSALQSNAVTKEAS